MGWRKLCESDRINRIHILTICLCFAYKLRRATFAIRQTSLPNMRKHTLVAKPGGLVRASPEGYAGQSPSSLAKPGEVPAQPERRLVELGGVKPPASRMRIVRSIN